MMMKPLLVAGVLVACAGLSFLFALAEAALFTLSRWQLERLGQTAPRRGGQVRRLREQAEDLLATIVLGNGLANAGLVGLGWWLVAREGWSPVPVLGGALLLILVTGEVIPKTLAVRAPEFWAPRVAPAVTLWMRLSAPICRLARRANESLLRWLLPRGLAARPLPGEEEYRELIELAAEQGHLQPGETAIILRILALDRRMARDVMRPRAEVVALPDDLDRETLIAAARRLGYRRLPLYDGSLDTVVGILNTRRLLLHPEADPTEAIEAPSFVPETMNLLTLLRSLQRQRRGLAIVLDEFAGTAGVVTIEDILGFALGGSRPEAGGPGLVMHPLEGGGWRVSGAMRVEDFRRLYPQLDPPPGVDTLAGVVLARAGVVPAVGESVSVAGLRWQVSRADARRILELEVRPEPARTKEAA